MALTLGTMPAPIGAQPVQAPLLVGRYRLQGIREVGATLELLPNGRFEYSLTYGGVDASAQGLWVLDGITLSLTVDEPPAAGFTEGRRGADLLGDYASEADKPTLIVVRVSTPRLELTWSNMEIAAEFSNGLVRRGTTGRSGMLGFLQRTDPPWTSATIRRVSVAYPKADVGPAWFPVDASIKGLEVHFEPGPLIPAALQRASLLVGQQGGETFLVVQDGDLGAPGWRWVRRQPA